MTAGQEYGWEKEVIDQGKRYPKKQSAVTKYGEAMFKAGIFY